MFDPEHDNYFTHAMTIVDEEVADEGGRIPADTLSDGTERPSLLIAYTQLALTTGTGTTLENVHDAWAAWRAFSDRPDHSDLQWFPQLPADNASWDRPYVRAIRRAAERLAVERESVTGQLV